jgi:murein DD-endopeptidase MepM/ murein hydrolase activator NlpD
MNCIMPHQPFGQSPDRAHRTGSGAAVSVTADTKLWYPFGTGRNSRRGGAFNRRSYADRPDPFPSPNFAAKTVNTPRTHTRAQEGASGKPSTGFHLWQAGAALIALLLVALGGQPAEAAWPWPVPTDPAAITGTFMESRETRYHTGLDIRTEGRTGWPVHSPVSGEVRRIRCSARGYGLALYVEADSGETLVFAHLDRFYGPAARLLADAQAASGSYEQDLQVAPGQMPVGVGEVVALSGETGTGAPHVHLEVRDGAQRPLNPADFLDIPDRVPPEVLALRLLPLDPEAPFVLELDPGTVTAARGKWVAEVLTVDRTGYAPFPVAPRSVTLYVDGTMTYRLSQDAVAFDEAGQMRLDQTRDERGRWYRMQRREGSTLPARKGVGGSIEVSSRSVELFVVVEDSRGLRAEARFELRPEAIARPVDEASLRVTEHLLIAEFPGRSEMPPLLEGPDQHHLLEEVEGGWRVALPHAGLSDGGWRLLHRAELVRELDVRFAEGGLAGFAADGSLTLNRAEADQLHPGGALVLERVAIDLPGGMRQVGAAIAVHSFGLVPVRDLSWTVPGGNERGILMRHDGRAWKPVPGNATPAFGTFAYCIDETAPVIGDLEGGTVLQRTPPRAAHGVPLPPWPALAIPVVDSGSGLPETGPRVTLDGRPWPVRYDGERDRLLLDWFVAPPAGIHTLEVEALDLAGNRTSRSWNLEFRD